MTTSEKRSLFIAPLVDGAVDFIKARGAVTISELAEYLEDAGVDVRGDDELTGEELAYYRRNNDFAALSVIATGSDQFVLITLALLVNRPVELDFSNPTLIKLIWDVPAGELSKDETLITTSFSSATRADRSKSPNAGRATTTWASQVSTSI